MQSIRLGVLYPVGGGEWEYYRFAEALEWRFRPCLFCTPLYGEDDNHDAAALERTAAIDNLTRTARSIRPIGAHAAMWACTSGSFILGRAHAEAQAKAIAEAAGCPASSTSLAFVNAVQALGAGRVAVLASYPQAAASAFVRFLQESAIEVSAMVSLGAAGGQDAYEMDTGTLAEAARSLLAGEGSNADALLVPDTAIAGFDLVRLLEAELPMPVLSANQVTLWEGLRIADRLQAVPGHGRLLENVYRP